MQHSFGSVKGDTLCPLGFHPQVRWPTRCKRCFRDYKDHSNKRASLKTDTTSSSPSLSRWEPSPVRTNDDSENKRTWASTSNLTKEDEANKKKDDENSSGVSVEWTASSMDIPSLVESSLSSSSTSKRPKSYYEPQSDNYNTFRRHSIDETSLRNESSSANNSIRRIPKLQIKQVIDKSISGSENDVSYIIQVRKSNDVKSKDDHNKNDDNDKGHKEIERLKIQLSEMKLRCEKVEKEKSEILLRRLSSMDSVSNKSQKNSEIFRLQKSLNEMQVKYEALNEEKASLITRLKSMEKESGYKGNMKSERERANEELKSKLKAAETLCETLMDENEDMKKEIRELEEEIYEMQDNFREEQADEFSNIRKSLEQSNKNCRILSFKLRKLERKTEQLENEKVDFKNKYDYMKKIENGVNQFLVNFKNRETNVSNNDNKTKLQLKKSLDDAEKELGKIYGIFTNSIGIETNVFNSTLENNSKYETAKNENEILQQKLDDTLKELTKIKESNKSNEISSINDTLNLKKTLSETTAARDAEKKVWESEKTKLQEEKEKLKSKLLSLSAEKLKIYNEVLQLKKDLDTANSFEKSNAKMEINFNELKNELNCEKERCKKYQEDLLSITEREKKTSKDLIIMEQSKTAVENDLKQLKVEIDNIKHSTSMKVAKLTGEISELKKEKEKLKVQSEEDELTKEIEIANLKKKVSSLEKSGVNAKKLNELKQTYSEKISILEEEIKKSQDRFDELHIKHADLQDLKRKLENELNIVTCQLMDNKNQLEEKEKHSQQLVEQFQMKENLWNKEKVKLEEMLKEREKSVAANAQLADRKEKVNHLSKENESLKIQLEDYKKINDDLISKLNDFNAVSKVQRNLSADTSALEAELRKTKNEFNEAEKIKKSVIAECKLRYEQRIKVINDEIHSIQNQLSRYKRERDTYKHMLEGAQKTIAQLKINRQRRQSTNSIGKSSEDEDSTGTNVSVLERQISMMEDELSESKLEASKLKTELVSERFSWQIKLSELQSRINELEEERILASGRTKIPGLKAKIELAWQKEREDQQRLLQETATLARDLRQTLYEVERERDKERLENKRRQDQTKKIFDEEKEETKKKLIELQCDLLELRDAHAKLRTSNEKMRREKERHEKEREEFRDLLATKRRIEQNEAKNMNILIQQVDDLLKLFPEFCKKDNGVEKNPDNYTPTPPRRTKGPKSRESSPMLESREDINKTLVNGKTEKLEYTIKKLIQVAKELQESKTIIIGNSNSKKKLTKRSSSIDDDSGKGSIQSRSKPTLNRKSISLEQTVGKNDQLIWDADSNISSMQSLDSDVDPRYFTLQRDSSIDSRLSGGSTKSEMIPRDKRYNKNIIRKLTTKLTKSVSVDDPNSSFDFSFQNSGSEASIDDSKVEKKNLKKKISNIFKRGNKTSLDKKSSLDDVSRPSSRTSNAKKELT